MPIDSIEFLQLVSGRAALLFPVDPTPASALDRGRTEEGGNAGVFGVAIWKRENSHLAFDTIDPDAVLEEM